MNKSFKVRPDQLCLDLETAKVHPEPAPSQNSSVTPFVDAATLRVRAMAVERVKKSGIFSLKKVHSQR
jgi:hypothetical protein